MTTEAILDRVLVPRANGSEGLEQVGAFLAQVLQQSNAELSLHEFTATPHGFALAWTVTLVLIPSDRSLSVAIPLTTSGADPIAHVLTDRHFEMCVLSYRSCEP